VPSDQTLEKLADLLNKAQSVTLLCGSGCEGAHGELMQLAEALKAPIVHALRGKEHVEWENPYDVGMTGLIGFASGYQAMEPVDALLISGRRFPLSAVLPEECPPSPKSTSGQRPIGRTGSCSSLAWSARLAPPCVHAARPLSPNAIEAHLDAALKNYAKPARGSTISRAGDPGVRCIRSFDCPRGERTPRATTRSSPATSACRPVLGGALPHHERPASLVGSFWHGSMANAMAQAIGAQAAFPRRQ